MNDVALGRSGFGCTREHAFGFYNINTNKYPQSSGPRAFFILRATQLGGDPLLDSGCKEEQNHMVCFLSKASAV